MYPLKTKYPYNSDNLASTWSTYTTVYLGNYITGDFDEGSGSHLGVDIIPQVKNDNVVACLDGIVYFAGTNDSNGNYVVLKHENAPSPDNLSATTTLFSCHLHLSELSVKTGDAIKEGTPIGKSGNTGNSTGEHLHFQIDTGNAPFHPYWPFTMKEAKDAGLGFFEAVNKGLGIDNARKYSINPLVYLDKVSTFRGSNPTPIAHVVITPTPTFATKSKYFNDVGDNIEEIDFLAQKGITKGYGDGTFRPNSNITRAEILAMAFNFAQISLEGNGSGFSDVAVGEWYEPYIKTATAKGYIKGYADGTFKPNNPVTRAEAIAIILNIVVGKNNIANPADSDYQDVKVSDWFCRYTNFVSQNGLLDSIGKFYPCDNMKRSDLAVILYNLRDRV